MSFKLPKVNLRTTIKTPKISIPKLSFVRAPKIGKAGGGMGKIIKTSIKLK